MANLVGNLPRPIAGVIHGPINDLSVHILPKNSSRAVDQRLDEERRVEFVDVVLVHHCLIEAAERVSNLLRQILALVIEQVCKIKAQQRHRH